MSRRANRLDSQGQRILRANEYKFINRPVRRGFRADGSENPRAGNSGEAAPPTLLGGINGKNIDVQEKFEKAATIIPSQRHLGKMDAGERTNSIGVDWLQGTIPFEKFGEFQSYMNEMCGDNPEFYKYGLMSYQASAEWYPFNIKIAWDLDRSNRKRHNGRFLLVLSGTSLQCFPPVSLYRFMRDLSLKFWFKCSRIDLCFDDYEKIIHPLEVKHFANMGLYKGFQKHTPFEERKRTGELTNEGLSFGVRGGGGKYLRCYNKGLQTDGEIDAIRWEVEFSKGKADQIYFDLAMSLSLEDFATKIGLFIGGSIDFAERYDSGKFNPNDRLAFWEQILHHLGAAVMRTPTKEGSIEKTQEWIETSVSPSLEKMRIALGDEMYYQWLFEIMSDVKISDRAEAQISWYWSVNGEPPPF